MAGPVRVLLHSGLAQDKTSIIHALITDERAGLVSSAETCVEKHGEVDVSQPSFNICNTTLFG